MPIELVFTDVIILSKGLSNQYITLTIHFEHSDIRVALSTMFTGASQRKVGMDNPTVHLFVWALFTKRYAMAKYLLTLIDEPLGVSMMACAMYRHFNNLLGSQAFDPELIGWGK